MSKKLSITDKLDYIREFALSKSGDREGFKENDVAYEYLYDIVDYLIRNFTRKLNLSADVKEDLKQSVIVRFLKRNLNPKNSTEFTHLRTYLLKSIFSEISNLNRSDYFGVGIVNFNELEDYVHIPDSFLSISPMSSNFTKAIELESACKHMTRKIKGYLKELPIDAENKHLLLFPILRCIVTNNQSLLKDYPYRTKMAIKELIYEIGNPQDFLKL